MKVTTLPRISLRYLLTPQGLAEKSRLTYVYMQLALFYYRDMGGRLTEILASHAEDGTGGSVSMNL